MKTLSAFHSHLLISTDNNFIMILPRAFCQGQFCLSHLLLTDLDRGRRRPRRRKNDVIQQLTSTSGLI